jgi:glycine/D-amino acid oxidase-like deaminating enzyme
MARPSNHPDVLIIGAGLIGSAVAYESARRGLKVLLIDRADRAAQGATRWSQAGVSWLSHVKRADLATLSHEGLERHRTLSDELGADTGFRPIPMLVLAPHKAALTAVSQLLETGRGYGFDGSVITADDLRDLEPGLADGVAVGGVVCRQGHADPELLTRAWVDAATRLGAVVRYDVDVTALSIEGGRCAEVQTSEGTLSVGHVVIAAGAWTRRLLRGAGQDAPVLHTHAEILETDPLPPTLSHFVGLAAPNRAELELGMAAPDLRSRWDDENHDDIVPALTQFGGVQFADGRVRLGQVSRAVSGFLDGPRPDGEAAIRDITRTYFPALADLPAKLHGRPVAISADRLPIAGPLDDVPNLFVAAGYDSPLIYTPALAARLAAALTGQSTPDLDAFKPGRTTDVTMQSR